MSTNTPLGPTPTSEVLLDQVPVKALLDTGSTTSIVSLDFFIQTAARKRLPNQSPLDWGKSVRERLQPTTVSLRSYGGDELTIVSQVKCHLARGCHSLEPVLQVQRGAPVNLQLGTDVLPLLGFSLVQDERGGRSTNLLEDADKDVSSVAPPAEVKLIQATRLPARHRKLIRVEIDGQIVTSLFEPELQALGQRGIAMAIAVMGIGVGKRMTLVISNQGTAVQLEEGVILGKLQPVTLLDDWAPLKKLEDWENQVVPHVATIHSENVKERQKELVPVLNLDEVDLPHTELSQLKEIVSEYSDLFATLN